MKQLLPTLRLSFFLMALVLPRHAAASEDNLQVYFLDVGQGDATILHQPGHCTALIDAGPPVNGYRVTQKLQELDVSAIDLAIITHPHLDHFGGLFDLAPRFTIKKLYDNGVTDNNSGYFDNYQILKQQIPHGIVTAGKDLECGQIKLSILHPERTGQTGNDFNAESLVVMVTYKDFKLLQMGDLAGKEEQKFTEMTKNLKADVIKIAHHGAADSTSDKLLKAVQPKYAIISTATENRINSPSEMVLKRLSQYGITSFRTDRDKTIKLTISESGYQVSAPDI